MVAAYLRRGGVGLQIRIDMLDHGILPVYDLLIALDTRPGGTRMLPLNTQADISWDLLLIIPADGNLQVLDADLKPLSETGFLVVRDPNLDNIVISLSAPSLPMRLPRLQAYTTPAGSGQIADRSSPAPGAVAMIRPAQVLAAFSNTFPAYTPATALRRWNGAHTGPLGGSHGLAHLLHAAAEYKTPILLTDLARPEALVALDVVGARPTLQQMAADRLLILPHPQPVLPGGPYTQAVYDRLNRLQSQTLANFDLQLTTGASFAEHDLAQHDPFEATAGGPSPAVRRVLANTAAAANPPGGGSIVTLGGELPNSAWGTSAAARATLRYLASRPWIVFIGTADLVELADGEHFSRISGPIDADDAPGSSFADVDMDGLHQALLAAPDNALSDAAWQAYAALFAPVYPNSPELPAMRAQYIGAIWSLIAASRWAEQPSKIRSCEVDVDRDGSAECVLANGSIYAAFDLPGGALTHLFSAGTDGVHQWIAPSSQMITGLSDPSMWNPAAGVSADPAALHGAFYDFAAPSVGTPAGIDSRHRLSDSKLMFQYSFGTSSVQRSFMLTQTSMKVDTVYHGDSPYPAIPLSFAPDPWMRFFPDWAAGYHWSQTESSVSVFPPGEPGSRLLVSSNLLFTGKAFNDTLQILNRAENPDRDYPPGHFLPFPLFQVELPTSGESQVIIELSLESPLSG